MDTHSAIVGALVGHLIGDYLIQNDWMAQHKKQSTFRCAVHCALWTLAVCVLAGWSSPLVIGVLFVTHFAQDRTQIIAWWMDVIGQKGFRTGMGPWSIIIVDNVWHIVTIYLVWRFLT